MKLKRLHRMLAQTTVVVVTLAATLIVTGLPAQAGYVSVNRNEVVLSNFARPDVSLGIEGRDRNYGAAREYLSFGISFTIRDHPPNGHTIQEYDRQGRCLDSNHAGAAYGIPCNGGYYQRWHFIHMGVKWSPYFNRSFDSYEIRNWVTGRCLDANGQSAYTLGCNGGDYQRWMILG